MIQQGPITSVQPTHSQHSSFSIYILHVLHTVCIRQNISDIIFQRAQTDDIPSLSSHVEPVLPTRFTLKISIVGLYLFFWAASTAFLATSKVLGMFILSQVLWHTFHFGNHLFYIYIPPPSLHESWWTFWHCTLMRSVQYLHFSSTIMNSRVLITTRCPSGHQPHAWDSVSNNPKYYIPCQNQLI